MSDLPIIMSGAMVRATIEGRKGVTRRVVKAEEWKPDREIDKGLHWLERKHEAPYVDRYNRGRHACWWDEWDRQGPGWYPVRYAEGDRLWVREAWATDAEFDDWKPVALPTWAGVWWPANGSSTRPPGAKRGKGRASIHMPRAMSRITLDVTAVRIERLHAITDAEAVREGATVRPDAHWSGLPPARDGWSMDWSPVGKRSTFSREPLTERDISLETPRDAFASFWNGLHGGTDSEGSGPWDDNPWVAVIDFTVRLGNIDNGAA